MRSNVVALRHGLGITLMVIVWLAVAVVAASTLPDLLIDPNAQTAALIAAVALAMAGTIWRRRAMGMWLMDGAMVGLLAVGLMSASPPVPLLVLGVCMVAYFGILMSSRLPGLAWVVAGIVAQSVLASLAPSYVLVGGLQVNVGIVAVVQMAVTGLWLWWAWHEIAHDALAKDRLTAAREEEIAEALLTQERARAWREAITRTHETILNDIRYVLRAPEIDRGRLREQLVTTRDSRTSLRTGGQHPPGLGTVVREEFTGTVEFAGALPDDLPLRELEPVIREIVRNIERHADASVITVTACSGGDVVHLEIADNGVAQPGGTTPSIGRSIVLGESLAVLGGSIEESPHRTTITLPSRERRVPQSREPLRILMSVVLVGSAGGGSLQFLLLMAGAAPAYAAVTAAAFAVTVLAAVVVLRRRTAPDAVVWCAALAVGAVPWLLALLAAPCADDALALTTINLAFDAFLGLLLWTRSWWMWLLSAPVVAGVVALALGFGSGCVPLSTGILGTSLVLMPLFLGISLYSTAYAERRHREDEQLWRLEIAERAHAETAVDLARYLADSVDQAWELLWRIADGKTLDDDVRRRLRTLDSAIRAAIQVDPRTAGGLALVAHGLVGEAVAHDIPVHVRALRGSSDSRSLPPEVVDALRSTLICDPDGQASIHVFTDGDREYLALTTTVGAAEQAGIRPGVPWRVDDAIVEVELTDDEGDPSAEVVVLVRRGAPEFVASGVE